MCDSDSFDGLQETVCNAAKDYKHCDYSNLKAGATMHGCKTPLKKKTRQNDNSSDEIPCKGKKPSQTMALESCDNYQENTKLRANEEATTYKLKDVMEKEKEDVSDYCTLEQVERTVRNWESTYKVSLKKFNQYPLLNFMISDDKRMMLARVTSSGATIKFGYVELTIPEGALIEKKIVFIYMLGFTTTPGSIPLCPEVMCGPPGLRFETYVTLSVELFGNLPVPTQSLSAKALVLCKQGTSDWKTVSEADGSSFIKNNRSYILINHFTDFKTVLEQSNSDGTEHQVKHLIEISLSTRNGGKEIQVELRKSFENVEHGTNSVKYGYCDEASIIKIEVGDHQDVQVIFNQSARKLLNNNFSAITYSIPFPEIPMSCDVYMDESNFKMTPQNNELDTNQLYTFKNPKSNVNNICLKGVCSKIEMEINPTFEEFLFENASENERKRPINIELAVRKFLAENDKSLPMLITKLRECGMDEAAGEVKKILSLIAGHPARRPLPSTDSIQSLSSCASGNILTNQGIIGLKSDCGYQALPFEVNEYRKCKVYDEGNPDESEQPGNENIQEQYKESSSNINPHRRPSSPDEAEKPEDSEQLENGNVPKPLMESPIKDDNSNLGFGETPEPNYENVRHDLAKERKIQMESPYVKQTGKKN